MNRHVARTPLLPLGGSTGAAAAASESANKESQSDGVSFRVRGVPADWTREQLQGCLNSQENGLQVSIKSLATETGEEYQSATITFTELPLRLQRYPDWEIVVPATFNATVTFELSVDKDFYGLTTLFAPAQRDHEIDVIALSGLGSHAFGSFKQRKGSHMWLRDSLPNDLTSETTNRPMARIMIYGYESNVANSSNMQNLEDLATVLHNTLLAIGTGSTLRPIIFVGHSLGGLIIKQLLVSLSKSEFEQDKELLRAVYSVIFFGTPHHGMDISALISMAGDGPNRFLLESVGCNSQVLSTLQRDFCSALGERGKSEIFCFYETSKSPTAVQNQFGQWEITGPAAILVTKSSATNCRPWEDGPEHICAIARTHSEIVKFGRYDTEYRNVRERMRAVSRRALAARDAPQQREAKFLVPYPINENFISRPEIQDEIRRQFGVGEYDQPSRQHTRVSLCGLGGTGKTQIAIDFAYWLRSVNPDISVFWVHASNAHRLREAYARIAKICNIPGINDLEADVLSLVKEWLESPSNSRWLMIVDSADDEEFFFPSQMDNDVPTERFDQYFPNCIHGQILFTTTNHQVGTMLCYGKPVIKVPKMTDGEAYELVKAILPGEIFTAEISILSSRLENLPLALVQAASYIRKYDKPINEYLRSLQNGDLALVQYLSEPCNPVGRDSEAPLSVAKTWAISFDQIERNDKVANDILSFLGVLHYQAMPITFIELYCRMQYRNNDENSISCTVSRALDLLRSFSFISVGTGQEIDMHRLVHLMLQKWLIKKGRMDEYVIKAMSIATMLFPMEDHGAFLKYLAHAHSVLRKMTSRSRMDYIVRIPFLDQIMSYLQANHYYSDVLQELMEQVVEMNRIHLGPEDPITVRLITELGAIQEMRGQLKEAELSFKQALELHQRVLGDDHPYTIDILHHLGNLYRSQDRFDEAEKFISQALEKNTRVLGPDHHVTLVTMRSLSMIYRDQDRDEEADDLEMRTFELSRATLGVDHPFTLAIMQDLADQLYDRGEFKPAEDLAEHTLEQQKLILRPGHPAIISSMTILAMAQRGLGKLFDAIGVLESCLSAMEEQLEPDHARKDSLLKYLAEWRKEAETSASRA